MQQADFKKVLKKMEGLGDKTPVSCLQEYLVSKKIVPKYELTRNGVGSHKPEFTYRVQVEGLWEEGTGRSKQEAKHRAAEKMLKSLKVIDGKGDEEDANEFQLESLENYVGQLKEVCFFLHYPEPKYLLEEAAGPPHNRIFKMICCVSTLQDFGISKTKKQAKHQAAFKMLERLKGSGKKIEDAFHHSENFIKLANKMTDEEVTEKYCAMRSISSLNYKDPAAFYKDYHNAYIGLQETSPTLAKVINDSKIINFESSLSLLQEIAKELEVTLSTSEVPSKKECVSYSVMSMSVFPPIAAVGIGEKNAAFNLLNSLLVLSKD